MNLQFIDRVNKLTEEIISVRTEILTRQNKEPHPRVGLWRHHLNIENLKFRAEYLEKKRLALLSTAPRVMRGG